MAVTKKNTFISGLEKYYVVSMRVGSHFLYKLFYLMLYLKPMCMGVVLCFFYRNCIFLI